MDKKVFTVLIGSPSDTQNERKIITDVIQDLNKDHGNSYNFHIETLKWEEDAFPDIGVDSQEVINRQLDKYDIFIGLLSKRFGTPTTKALSGTAEEFEIAFDKYILKPNKFSVLFYFKNENVKFHDIDIHQAILIHRFKERLEDLGVLYFTFETEVEFRKLLNRHILKTIQKLSSNKNSDIDLYKNELSDARIIQYNSWKVRTKKSTPQWTNFYEIDLRPFNYSSYTLKCLFKSSSDYFRFGFKLLHPKGKMFGDGSIQSKDENILFHIGKNLRSHSLFSTVYQNGIRTRLDKKLIQFDNDTVLLTLKRESNNLVSFYVNNELDEEIYVSPNLNSRIILLMWGDENEYEGEVKNIQIELNK